LKTAPSPDQNLPTPATDISLRFLAKERIVPMKKLLLLAALCCLAFGATATASEHRSGEDVYETYCHTCHATGVAGAPKFGDHEAWKPLIAKGVDQLVEVAKSGKGAMPPMGTCSDCSMDELEAAVKYMVENSQ